MVKNKKIVAIAGASSGTGREMATYLAGLGYAVSFSARREKLLDELESEIKAKGGEAMAVRADMAIWEEAKRFIEETVNRYGRIDVLVNNVGAGIRFADFDDYSIEEIEQGVAVNLMSVIYASKAAIPHMKKESSGHIINVSSILGKLSRSGFAIYSAAKQGVEGFSRALLNEVRKHGIKVSILAPAAIQTAWAEKAGVELPKDTHFLQPGDLAKAVQILIETPPHVDIWNLDMISLEQVIDPI